MKKLSAFSESHDNNFNLIRIAAALGVFISHCFPLSGYSFGGKPQLLGFLSLNVFFIISGFLVTKSYFNRESTFSYFRARALRVFPALFVAVIYSVFVIGLVFSTLPINEYLRELAVYEYFFKNSLLILPSTPDYLPSVFLESKYRPTVNAPLWSLPYEIWCYLILAFLAIVTSARQNVTLFSIVVVSILIICYGVFATNYVLGTSQYAILLDKEAYRLAAMFLLGVAAYLFKDYIKLSHWIVAIILIVIILSSSYRPIFVTFTYVALAYLTFYFAYVPSGHIRQYNKLGDYSYGVYIFGYPTQQALGQVLPNLSLVLFFLISFLITLMLAVTSWHCIEKKVLSYRELIER